MRRLSCRLGLLGIFMAVLLLAGCGSTEEYKGVGGEPGGWQEPHFGGNSAAPNKTVP